jgi:hypothetical protein
MTDIGENGLERVHVSLPDGRFSLNGPFETVLWSDTGDGFENFAARRCGERGMAGLACLVELAPQRVEHVTGESTAEARRIEAQHGPHRRDHGIARQGAFHVARLAAARAASSRRSRRASSVASDRRPTGVIR